MAFLERDHIRSAVRFWEFARIFYNLALLTLVMILLFANLGAFEWQVILSWIPGMLMLAVLANVVFCVAYPFDLIAQATPLNAYITPIRWTLLVLGTLQAIALAAIVLFGMTFAGGLGPGD